MTSKFDQPIESDREHEMKALNKASYVQVHMNESKYNKDGVGIVAAERQAGCVQSWRCISVKV